MWLLQYIMVGLIMLLSSALAARAQAVDNMVLFDDTHGQTAGNADWTPHGAYSDLAALFETAGFTIRSLSHTGAARFDREVLRGITVVVAPEPNVMYRREEKRALRDFIETGGGLLVIADHGGSDRDFDGFDSVDVFNSLLGSYGLFFTGSTFSEAPVSGCVSAFHPVMNGLRSIGAFAATGMRIMSPDAWRGLLTEATDEAYFIVAGEIGRGRVVAIGDSSLFDDGTGAAGDNLHRCLDSPLYQHEQLALNSLAWLAWCEPVAAPARNLGLSNHVPAQGSGGRMVLVDAAHGNADADKLQWFIRDLAHHGMSTVFLREPLENSVLEPATALVITSPSLPIRWWERQAIASWVKGGGRLIIAAARDRNPLCNRETLNRLLATVGSGIRFNDDEVWDETDNSDRPWGVMAHTFSPTVAVDGLRRLMTWGGCSLVDKYHRALLNRDGIELLVTGDGDTVGKDGDTGGDAFMYPAGVPVPLAAREKIGDGIVLCIGSPHLTDYQYAGSEEYPPEFRGIEHQTESFNRWLVIGED
ncbi:hypothetical protein JW905_16685 [bacterium]|nr:hypothetical protein [candidate division CSSED10-310 bacterium]